MQNYVSDSNSLYEFIVKNHEKLNWNKISDLLIRSGLGSIGHNQLVDLDQTFVPEELLLRLKNFQLQVARQNAVLMHDFLSFSDALKKNGVNVIPFKGIYLSTAYYKKPSHRQMTDVDILIEERDIQKSLEIVQRKNWRVDYTIEKSRFHQKHYRTHEPYNFFNGRTIFDVHINLLSNYEGFHVDIHQVIERSSFKFMGSQKALTLDVHDTIIHSFIHLYKHIIANQIKLNWFLDLELLLAEGQVEKKVLIQRVNEYNCSKAFRSILHVLRSVFDYDHGVEIERPNSHDLLISKVVQNKIEHSKISLLTKTRLFLYRRFSGNKPLSHHVRIFFFNIFPSRQYLTKSSKFSSNSYWTAWWRRIFLFARR